MILPGDIVKITLLRRIHNIPLCTFGIVVSVPGLTVHTNFWGDKYVSHDYMIITEVTGKLERIKSIRYSVEKVS